MGKIIRLVFTYFFPIIMIDYYLIMRGVNLNAIIVLPIFALIGIKALEIAYKQRGDQFIIMMNVFLTYSLFSGVFYIFNDAPFSCYIASLRSFFFPILFAYLGYGYSNDNAFNKWYLIGCAFCFLMGFYLYIVGPSYFTSFLSEARSNLWYASENPYLDESNILEFSRFSSFFTTSYVISCFSIPSLALSMTYISSGISPLKRHWSYLFALVSFIAALLCQQRIAIAFAVLVVLFFVFFSGIFVNAKRGLGLILVSVVIISIALLIINQVDDLDRFVRISELVGSRFEAMRFSDAMSDRIGQYSSFDRSTPLSFVFGLGLGSCGHAAGAAGLKAIHDGEFVKLFYEFGLIGCTFLAVLVISTIIRGVSHYKLFIAELIIIFFYLAAGIGSDSLTFFVYSAMFWYSLGRVWNNDYFELLRKERLGFRYGLK